MGFIIVYCMLSLNGVQDLKFCMNQSACTLQWNYTNEHGRST